MKAPKPGRRTAGYGLAAFCASTDAAPAQEIAAASVSDAIVARDME